MNDDFIPIFNYFHQKKKKKSLNYECKCESFARRLNEFINKERKQVSCERIDGESLKLLP